MFKDFFVESIKNFRINVRCLEAQTQTKSFLYEFSEVQLFQIVLKNHIEHGFNNFDDII